MGDEIDVEPIEVEINEDIKKSLKKLSLPLELVPESARMQVKQSVRNLNSQIIGEMNGEKVHLVRCEDVFLHIGPNPELLAKSATLGKTGRYALLEISKNYAYCIFSIDIKKSPTIVSIGDYDEKEDLLIYDTQFGANVSIIGIKSDRLFFDLRTAEIIDKCADD
jgi:hypothetical protein